MWRRKKIRLKKFPEANFWLLSPLQVHFTEIRVREIEKKKYGMMYNVFNAELLFKI